jgi:hypothetical protein
VFITLILCIGYTLSGFFAFRKLLAERDPALAFGVAALMGLGSLGLLSFLFSLTPLGFKGSIALLGSLALLTLVFKGKELPRPTVTFPSGALAIIPVACGLAGVFALVSVLTPSDISDWDSLAYHLAVPKLWAEAGHPYSVPGIHHSNFPAIVDILYTWPLLFTKNAEGAKFFQFFFYLAGMLCVFGFARQRYGEKAAWWALLAYAMIPAALWEAGTAYIDLAHGLYAGFGILYAAQWLAEKRKEDLWLAAILLGFGAASKYTGLQTIFAAGFVLLIAGFLIKEPRRAIAGAVTAGILGIAIASPWLIKNAVTVGNPVYPYFYEKLGGKDWSQRQADIYKNEQQTFGVGRTETGRDPSAVAHAVLGLAYQPGRFTNPGQEQGAGSPLHAVGVAVIAALLAWLISGRAKVFEGSVLGVVVLSAVMWFFLSQQSRYILTWAIPLAVLGGGAVVRLAAGQAVAGIIALQALVTLYMSSQLRFSMQLPVVLGTVSAEDYQRKSIPFYEASEFINKEVKGKVALYDEVFGSLLDVPYFWANPGHSTQIPYDQLKSGADFAAELKKQGFTHVYISISPVVKDRAFAQRWLASMGLIPGEPIPDEERQRLLADWQSQWQILLADAVRDGQLKPVQTFRNGVLFEL